MALASLHGIGHTLIYDLNSFSGGNMRFFVLVPIFLLASGHDASKECSLVCSVVTPNYKGSVDFAF